MKKIIYFLLALMMVHCKERYDVPFASPTTGYLVVEGMINPDGDTKITLSRTTKLADRSILHETGAAVQVQGEDNSLYPLTESDSGTYLLSSLHLNPAIRYRLHILTSSSKEYVSAYTTPIFTPVIDSVSWLRQNGGVEIFVNSHDNANNIHYYKWDYEETWEFRSPYRTNTKFVPVYSSNGDIVSMTLGLYDPNSLQDYDDSIWTCWQSRNSSQIEIGTTAELSNDRVYRSLVFYTENSWELSMLYSINVKQYALSKAGYEFFDKIRKNTESLGSIFDVQPSEIKGNITSVTDPSEQVIGYVDVSSVHEMRKFISNAELPGWNYNQGCASPIPILVTNTDSLLGAYYDGLIPLGIVVPIGIKDTGMLMAPKICVLCTVRGVHNKPSFWPQ